MSEITRVGVDLAKQVIQVHAVDAAGRRVIARALPRDKFVAWCAQLPARLHGGDGGQPPAPIIGRAGWWRWVLDARIMAAHLGSALPQPRQGAARTTPTTRRRCARQPAARPCTSCPSRPWSSKACCASTACARASRPNALLASTAFVACLLNSGLVFAQKPAVLRQALPDAIEDASNELGTLARLALQRAWATVAGVGRASGLVRRAHRWPPQSRRAGTPSRAAAGRGAGGPRRQWWPVWATLGNSRTARSSAPGWGWCQGKTPAAAKAATWAASPNAATRTCAPC